jgi:serpin B
VITPLTRLVLTNAIYFNSAWSSPFMEQNTQPGPFTGLDGKQSNVPVMNQQATFGYFQGQGYQAVNLPYINAKLSMLVILPEAGKFSAVEKGLSPDMLDQVTRGLRGLEVRLALPKFHIESEIGLNEALKGLGMTDAFDPAAADFSGMDGTRTLYISDVVHKSYVTVDEKGTEAAAATAVVIGKTSIPAQVIQFTVDRPFFFAIQDTQTGAILFMGRVTNL